MKLDIAPDQHEKLKDAVNHGKSVSMKINIGGGKKNYSSIVFSYQRTTQPINTSKTDE